MKTIQKGDICVWQNIHTPELQYLIGTECTATSNMTVKSCPVHGSHFGYETDTVVSTMFFDLYLFAYIGELRLKNQPPEDEDEDIKEVKPTEVHHDQ